MKLSIKKFLRKKFFIIETKNYNIQITYYKPRFVDKWIYHSWTGNTLMGFRIFGININFLSDNIELREYILLQGIL
jgi:hypothetical protein